MLLLVAMSFILAGMSLKDSILGVVLFFIGMIMLIRSVTSTLNEIQKPQEPKEKTCPPHKWDYDISNQMYCKICKKSPNQIGSDYDKPY